MTPHRTRYIAKRLGQNFAAARRLRGLRQVDVADRMRVETGQYARLERGEHASSVVLYLDAFWALNMSPEEFFHKLDERVP